MLVSFLLPLGSRLAEDVVEVAAVPAVLPCCCAAVALVMMGIRAQVQVQLAGASAGQVIGSMGDDEDGWINGGVNSQRRIGRGEARLKGDVEDWTGPQARSYAVGVTLHRPHFPICHVHSRLPDGIRARRHLPQHHASPACVGPPFDQLRSVNLPGNAPCYHDLEVVRTKVIR